MEATVSYLLVPQKCISLKQNSETEVKPYPLCLGNISKDFTIDNMKKTGLKGYVHVFSANYNIIDTNDILDIYRY